MGRLPEPHTPWPWATLGRACPDGIPGSGVPSQTLCWQESRRAGLGWAWLGQGAPAMCVVLVKEKLAPQGSLLALPSEHRPEGGTPLRGSLRTRSVCTRIMTRQWVMKLGY